MPYSALMWIWAPVCFEQYTSLARSHPTQLGLGISATPQTGCTVSGNICSVTVAVTNTGQREGDAVVLAFFRPRSAALGPSSAKLKSQLWAFERVHLGAAKSTTLTFDATARDLMLVDEQGERRIATGDFELRFSVGGGGSDVVQHCTVPPEG